MRLLTFKHRHRPRAKKLRHIFQYYQTDSNSRYWDAREEVVEIFNWCECQFGASMRLQPRHVKRRWHHVSRVSVLNAGDFQFMNDEDAFAFKMRWY